MDLHRVYDWQSPTRLLFGPGCAELAGEALRKLGGTRALVVTGPRVRASGALDGVARGLGSADVAHAVFSGVEPDPPIRCLQAGAALYESEGCDCLLAVGGGSAIDTAKGIGALASNGGLDVRDMEGQDRIQGPIPPLIAVPTTCGTGSEVSPTAIITDPERRQAMRISSPWLRPRTALLDGRLLATLPAPVVVATGMDAFCSSLESYVNLNAQPVSDCLNLQAIGTIARWLRPAVANRNLEAMSHLLLAGTIAAMGWSNTRLTLLHAMSHPLTAFYGVPHGIACAILLPHVMEFSLIGNAERFGEIARAMGEDTAGLGGMEAAGLSVRAARRLIRDVGIPGSLAEYGVDEALLPRMVEDTLLSGNVPLNPVRVSREAVAEVFRRAMRRQAATIIV